MTNTPDTPAQLSDLMRSVEARITTLQHERQALVTRAARHSSDAERLLLALVGRAEAPRGRPRTKDAIATAAKRRWAAQRDEGAESRRSRHVDERAGVSRGDHQQGPRGRRCAPTLLPFLQGPDGHAQLCPGNDALQKLQQQFR